VGFRKAILQRKIRLAGPFKILRGNFSSMKQSFAGIPPDQLAEDLFAFAGTITPGGIIKIASNLAFESN
jgi:hypothetical protein